MSGFWAVVRKEWLSLRPFAWFLAALYVVGLIMVQVTEYFDVYPMWSEVVLEVETGVIVTALLCLVVGMGLMVRESNEGTLTFLDGLPVRRITVYTAKWLVAVLVISLATVLWFLEALVYEWLSRTSVSSPIPWRSLMIYLGLELFLGAFFITVAVCFSFARRWGWLMIAGLCWCVYGLRSLQVPFSELLNPFQLIQPPFDSESFWEWPTLHFSFLLVVMALAWWVGFGLFSLRVGWYRSVERVMRETWWGKLGGGCTILLIVVMGFGLMSVLMWDEFGEEYQAEMEKAQDQQALVESGNNILTEETRYFRFVFRGKQEERVEVVMESADEVFETVANFLELPEAMREERVTVDFSSPLAVHNAGQAYWKKIRMSLPKRSESEDDPESETFAILGHEVAHVMIDQISDGRLEDAFNSARWFHEGLASYIEFRFFRNPGDELGYERWVGIAATWKEVRFPELANTVELFLKRDPHLVYPAGYLWCRALVDVYGDEAPATVLRAIGSEGFQAKDEGLALWRNAFLTCDYDLERVRTRFRSMVANLRDQVVPEYGDIEEVTEASARREGAAIVLTPLFESGEAPALPAGAQWVARARPRRDAPQQYWRSSRMKENGTFEVPALSFLSKEIGLQVGVMVSEEDFPIFGEWITVTVDGKVENE